MFKQFKQVLIFSFVFSFAALFIGCGGGGVSDALDSSGLKQNPVSSSSSLLRGSVIKGPVSGATVQAYKVVNGVRGGLIGVAVTAADGSYSLPVTDYSGPLVIEAFDGQYTDEATGLMKVLNRSMNSVVPKFSVTKPAMVSPLTHVAAAIVSEESDLNETSIQNAINEVSEFYSLSDILVTTPSIITDSTVSVSQIESNQLNYGLILSAISRLGSNDNTDPLEVMEIIAKDASDGSFDGQDDGNVLMINNQEISADFATKDVASSINDIVESLSGQVVVTVDPEFLFNLETTGGVIENSSIKLSVRALPKLTSSNLIQLIGEVSPGAASIEILQNTVKISEFFTGLDGQFSVQIPLLVNQLNNLIVRARNGGAISERTIQIREDSLAPSFQFLTTVPEYLNSASLSLSYTLTDAYGSPASVIATIGQGDVLVTSSQIQLSNLVEGNQLLQLEIFDQLNNRITQAYPLFIDFSAPQLETAVPTITNANFGLAFTFDENLSSLSYRFYHNQQNPSEFSNTQANIVNNFDFQDVQGTHILEVQALDLSQNITNYSTQIVFDSRSPYFVTTPTFTSLINSTTLNFTYAVESGVAVTLVMTAPDSASSSIILSGSPVTSPIDNTQGLWNLSFMMQDAAQNHASYSTSFTLDTIAPSAPSATPSTTISNANQVDISLSGEAGTILLIDGLSHGVLPTSTTLDLVSNSVTTFQFALQDLAGNLSSAVTVSVTQDSLPPSGVVSVSVPDQEYLVSTNSIEFIFVSNQIEPGATAVVDFLSTDYVMSSTDQIRFSTSVSLSLISTELDTPNYVFSISDALNNSTSFSGSLTNKIDTISPALSSATTTPIVFSTDFLPGSTYVGGDYRVLMVFELSKVEQEVEVYYGSNFIDTFSNTSSEQVTFRVDEYPQSDPDFLSFRLTASDAAGNTFTTNSISPFVSDTSPPVPTLVTNDAPGGGFLQIGDSITFTLSMQSDEPGLEVSATYNLEELQFDYVTSSLGNYYQATYTIDQSHTQYDGTPPDVEITSITDRAGNEAVVSGEIHDVQSGFDNILPSITSVSISTAITKTLILSDVVEFLITANDLGTNPSTPLSPIGTFNSETLSFSSADSINFLATYVVAYSSINSDGPLTAEFRVKDAAGNLSATSSITITHGIDSGFVDPSSLIGSITQTYHRLKTGDIVTLTFEYDEDPELDRIESEAFGVSLTFVASSGNNWTTNLALPDTLIVTDRIELNDTIFYEVNLNQSAPQSYVLTQLSTTQTPFVTDVNIDTLKPLVAEITHNITTDYLGIGDSVSFAVFPTYGDLSSLISVPPLDLTSLILNIQYNEVSLVGTYISTLGAYLATYTVSESHISRTAPIPLTNVFFTDSEGRIGSSSALLELSSARQLQKMSSLVDPLHGIQLTRITSGSFMMGSAVSELFRDVDEFDQHEVTITSDYFIGVSELTQAQWESIMGGTDSWPGSVVESPSSTYGRSLTHPAYFVSWEDITKVDGFLDKLNSTAGCSPTNLRTDGLRYSPEFVPAGCYRLPTEAEWEFAARGGTTGSFSYGNDTTFADLQNYAWFNENSNSQSQPVSQKLSNPLGLYDVHGNVAELVYDFYQSSYSAAPQTNPTGPISGSSGRVIRGGSWNDINEDVRSASRHSVASSVRQSDIGFRLLKTPLVLSNFVIDSRRPAIESVSFTSTSTNNTLKVGDNITFIVTPTQSSNDATSLTGQFNSIPITFVTTNSGQSFIGTYTVALGHTDQLDALDYPQLQGLQLIDASGNEGSFFDLSLAQSLLETEVWIDSYFGVEFSRITSGTFMMGSTTESLDSTANEYHQHQVTISKDMYLGTYEVTQGQWEAVMGGANSWPASAPNSPSSTYGYGSTHPAYFISWHDITKVDGFLDRLNQASGCDISSLSTGIDRYLPSDVGEGCYRLPTEAEWEFAARGGTTSSFSYGEDTTYGELANYSWYASNSTSSQPVGQKLSNPFGLFDVHGNVSELVYDTYSSSYTTASRTDPVNSSASTTQIVTRGGSWNSQAKDLRSAARNPIGTNVRGNDIGFRLLRVPTDPSTIIPNDLSEATDFEILIDANIPSFESIAFSPSNTAGSPTTIGIGSTIIWDLPFLNPVSLANGDDQLSVVGNFLNTTFSFAFVGASDLYRGSYTVSDSSTPYTLVTFEQIEITVTDSAGNTLTTSTADMGIKIDATRPVLQSLSVVPVNTAVTTLIGISERLRVSATLSAASTSGGTDPLQNVVGSLNGESLTFTVADTFTWEAFYTVDEGDDPSNGGTVLVTEVYAIDLVGNSSSDALTASTNISFDTTRPVISSVSVSNNSSPTTDRLKVGNIIEFSLPQGSYSTDIQSVTGTFNSTSFSFEVTGDPATWRATYTISEGQPDQTISTPELSIDASDAAGNSLTSFLTTDVYRFDANTPFISSFTHDATLAGILYTHNDYTSDETSITFTLGLTTPDLSLSVEAFYNNTTGGTTIPLVFSPNSDGSQYIATYYVQANHKSRSSVLQLTGLTISDAFGNFDTTSTSDIQKTIETAAPSLQSIISTTNLMVNTVPNTSTHLKIGDELEFLATFAASATAITLVTAEFNSQILNFTSNTPTQWIATYTVIEGHPSPVASVPLRNLRALDEDSRMSAPGSVSVTRIVDATRPVLLSLEVTSNSAVSTLSDGDFINFEFVPHMQSGSVDTGGTVSATYNGVTLNWAENTAGIYSSTYTVSTTHADSKLPLQLRNLLFYDIAGNIMTPPASTVEAMQGVTLGIDATTPSPPIVTPQYLTTDTLSYSLSIDAEAGTSLYVNSILHSEIPVGGTTNYVASLNANTINTYSFYLIDAANKQSPTTFAQIFVDSFARQQALTSSFSGLKTTNVGITLIQESRHDSNRFFVYGRAGLGEIAFDSEIYTDRNAGLDNATVNAIAEHPQTASSNVILLGKDNGLYRSTDSGLNWVKVDPNIFDSRAVNDVHFMEVNPTNVWVATNLNIYKSTDTGESFSNFNNNGPDDFNDPQNTEAKSIFFVSDTSRLYAAMQSGLFHSNSNGTSWSSKLTDEPNILEISQPSGQPETLFILTDNNFLRSTSLSSDLTSSLTTITSDTLSTGDVNAIAFGTTAGVIFAASASGIFESTDNGSSWNKSHQATGAGFPDSNYTAISAVTDNSNRIIIGSNASLHKILNINSDPYSQNDLTSIFPAKVSYVSSRNSDLSTVWALTEMWIYEYNVASDNWLLISPATPISTYTFVEPHPIKDDLFVGSETTGVSTMDYSGTKSTLSLPITTSNTHVTSVAFHPINSDVVLVGTEHYGLFQTSDGGSNFATSSNGLGIVTVTAIVGDTSNVIVATTTGVAHSSGADWSNLIFIDSSCSVNSASQINIVSDSNGLYLVAEGDLYRAANDCTSITNLTSPDFAPSVLSSLIITSSNALNHLIYIGTEQGLYRSRDGGTSFTAVDDTVKLNTHSITLIENTDETHKILIGTDAGSYILSDIKLD